MKMKMSPSKKRGKPSKNAEASKGSELIKAELIKDGLMKDNAKFIHKIAELNHQIIGFRAVISYLENHLKLESSQ